MAELRHAAVADVEPLFDLVHSAYRGDSARRGWTHEADLLDGGRIDRAGLAALLTDPDQSVIVAQEAGRLTGCVQVTRRGGDRAYLGMLSVDPSLQARGLGRRLVLAAEDEARLRFAARRMEMTVIVQRAELIAWYERLGYAATGETRPFPAADPRFGRPRRDDLAFVVLEKGLGDVIVTPRFTLRPARPDDADALHALFTRPDAMRWWSTPPHEALDQTRAWLDSMIQGQQSGLDLLIEVGGRPVGKVGFWRPPEIGFILHPDLWGRGIAREAAALMLDRLFAWTTAEAAEAEADPDNAASIRLLERLGFRRTGFEALGCRVGEEWKPSLYFSLPRGRWAAGPRKPRPGA